MYVTIFRNVWERQPYRVSVETLITRIKEGNSKELIQKIRNTKDKKERTDLKANLPCIRFSVAEGSWTDDSVKSHSGIICLDFDNIADIDGLKAELCCDKYVYACFVSPSFDGVKVLVKVPPTLSEHRGRFKALQEYYKLESFDQKCINPSRICYESFDPDIWINPDAEIFTGYIEEPPVEVKGIVSGSDSDDIFKTLQKWMQKKSSFTAGGRNHFIFTLACACKRNGLDIDTTISRCSEYVERDFSYREIKNAVRSAYRKEQTQHTSLSTT